MPDDINNLDTKDEGLKGIFGDRFTDMTANEKLSERRKSNMSANTDNAEKTAQKSTHKPTHDFKDGKWEPIKERTWMDNLKGCVQWAGCFGGLSFLLFYWEQAGLMAESIAVPCMCICTALAGVGIGKHVR